MSRYTAAAANILSKDNNDDDDYDYTASGVRVERDFLRRNFSAFHSIAHSLDCKYQSRSSRFHFNYSMKQPHYNYLQYIKVPHIHKNHPQEGICTHFLRRGYTKPVKYHLGKAVWSADARWLVLGTESGDFALWEGDTLKVHKVVSLPAHKVLTDGGKVQDYVAVTAMAWNHHGNILASGDNNGLIQYCDDSFRSDFIIREAHNSAIRGLNYCPHDSKVASCSDDGLLKIWTIGRDTPDLIYQGHQSEIKCMDYHPFRSLIVTGSRDSSIKLWDPNQRPESACVSNISSHKKTIMCCQWNPNNGNLLATGAKDAMVKIFDIRMMKEIQNLRGHNSDVCSMGWHPQIESLLLTGGYNGSMIYWVVGQNDDAHTAIADAHRQSVDVISWHPAGNLIASTSHDCILKFWCREPPGSRITIRSQNEINDTQPPIYGHGPLPTSIPPGSIPNVILQSAANSIANAAANQTVVGSEMNKSTNQGSKYQPQSRGGNRNMGNQSNQNNYRSHYQNSDRKRTRD